jgi:UDP-N-acetylglucosamine/UDP-N-acetylgalactosamine diphosphorylase
MAGGTSRKNHSEIGSSYIHFNYTPHQDKATPSLVGDVPRGVMLNRPPIFLGGQGGLVGPSVIEFGTVIPAGTVFRGDVLEEGTLALPRQEHACMDGREGRPFDPAAYRRIGRILRNNLLYLGNLWALTQWYDHVRRPLMADRDIHTNACFEGALEVLRGARKERIARMGAVAARMPTSIERGAEQGVLPPEERQLQERFFQEWHNIESALQDGPASTVGGAARERFLSAWAGGGGHSSHVEAVAALTPKARSAGTEWLDAVVSWAADLSPDTPHV